MKKIERNDPCPCGSGKKYKQCCLKRDETHAASKRAEAISIPQILQAAIEHHQAGRLAQAEAIYQQILQVEPNNHDALHLLGVLARQDGRSQLAAELIGRAIQANPSNPMCYINLGNALKDQNKLDAAAGSYRQAITLKPDFAEAYYHLGLVLQAQDKLADAVESYLKALSLRPNYAEAHNNLGFALQTQGEFDAAAASFRKALSIKHDFPAAYYNLGNTLQTQGKLNEAVECFHHALLLKPDFAEAHFDLGNTLQAQGKLDEAVECFHHALSLKPDFAETHNNLGIAFHAQGKLDAAVECFHQALSLKPDFAGAYNNLGHSLQALGKYDAAIESFHKALLLKPDYAEVHSDLGLALLAQDKLGAAVEHFIEALSIKPDFAEAHSNLGLALQIQGKLDEAAMHCLKALSIKPDYAEAYSNLLFALNYHPDLSPEDIYKQYQEYNTSFGIPFRSTWRPHTNDKNPGRRLRIGYVSPDFRRHSCRSFLEPLLAHHDKSQVEIFAYAELIKEDAQTARYKSYVEHWISTKGMSDEALAERIRSDGIDILVEWTGHSGGNRLLTFARKPAPVSLSWLGYGYTTGLGAIDYYLTDEASVPMGSEHLFAELPWRVATPVYTYRPTEGMGEINSLPAQQRGYITFGTLTRAVRVNHRTVRVWSEILKAVPNSRFIMDSNNFKDPAMQEQMAARFSEHGIIRERLEIGYHSPPWNTLRSMDIGLDCFPHNSGTTLFESLYMGVPFVTLAGRPSVGRLGSSILHGVGHPEWIAESEDDYVAKAVELASDHVRLSEIRATLRDQMTSAPIMDEAGFARKIENAYRGMWIRWCDKNGQINTPFPDQ